MICDHFGTAPEFTLYDQKTQSFETIPNTSAGQGHGQCSGLSLLMNRDIVAVICKEMGRSAITRVEQAGIKVYMTEGETVEDAIGDFLEGRLIKLDPEAGCMGLHAL
jgi:predicted Fe-Mo cluster-binding NifX family protein